jgi:hypothetical protein
MALLIKYGIVWFYTAMAMAMAMAMAVRMGMGVGVGMVLWLFDCAHALPATLRPAPG